MWTRHAQQILGLERRGDYGWHAVLRVLVALGGIPEVMGDEPHHQAFRCWPGKGCSRDGERPCFKVSEVGGERSQGVLAQALLDQVAQGCDILVREQSRELIRRS